MKKIIISFFLISICFLFFSSILMAEENPPILIAGGPSNNVKGVIIEKNNMERKKSLEQKPPEYEVVAFGIFPSSVARGYPLSPIVAMTVGLKNKKTGEFEVLPVGALIIFSVYHTTDGGISWKKEEGGENEFIFVVPSATEMWTIFGPQITLNNEISENKSDFYCFGIKIDT